MRTREWSGAALVRSIVIGAVLFPAAAAGQVTLGQLVPPIGKEAEKPAEGFYVTPALSIGELYDDNLFFTSTNRKQDFFTRVSPGIQAGYQSSPLTLLGGYTFDSEFYSKHQELNTIQMRQRALVELKSRPTELLTLSGRATYFKTRAPWEFNTLTGVAIRRIRADRLAFDPSIAYRFDPITKGTGDYAFSRDRIDGGISINSHILRLGLDRRISTTDTVTPGYVGRRFEFGGFGTTTSHAPTLAWKHELSPLTTLTLRAGPRFTGGSLDDRPEALVAIQHRLTHGEVSLEYSSIQTTIVGTPGHVIAESFRGSASYELFPHLHVEIAPNVGKITADTFKTTVYLLDTGLMYQLTKELALKGSHQFSLMRGNFSPTTGPGGEVEIPHNMFWLRLVVNFPTRVY